jgi:hypothetical protein
MVSELPIVGFKYSVITALDLGVNTYFTIRLFAWTEENSSVIGVSD